MSDHNTSQQFARWAPVARAAELARVSIEAAELHKSGGMSDALYSQRLEGIWAQVNEAGLIDQYTKSINAQIEKLKTKEQAVEEDKKETPVATPFNVLADDKVVWFGKLREAIRRERIAAEALAQARSDVETCKLELSLLSGVEVSR